MRLLTKILNWFWPLLISYRTLKNILGDIMIVSRVSRVFQNLFLFSLMYEFLYKVILHQTELKFQNSLGLSISPLLKLTEPQT